LDARPDGNIGDSVDVFMSKEGFAFEENAEVKEYLRSLVEGVWRKRHDIDNKMRMVLTGWRPERMVAVDRAVIRLAIFEGFLENTVPMPVAISEAVTMARFFGTEESGKFVNGVLGKVARLAEAPKDKSRNAIQINDKISNMDDDDATSTS
jgi:N utilization substance protein B